VLHGRFFKLVVQQNEMNNPVTAVPLFQMTSLANVEKCSWFCKSEDYVCYPQTFLSSDNIAELQTHYGLLQSTLDKQHQL